MDYVRAFAISAAGMALERTRVSVATLNLANANAAYASGTTGYQPLQVVARAADDGVGFAEVFDRESLDAALAARLPVASVEPAAAEPRMVYEPGHPAADGQGYVAYPAVDAAAEMMTLMSATRSYEANVAAMNAARSMVLKALDIGGA